MNKNKTKFKSIDEYHLSFPAEIQNSLGQLRQAIKQVAPKATETISYGMPAFRQGKVLVYYAAHQKHIGFYPTPRPIAHFKKELEKFKTSQGAIQFMIDQPLPLTLIKKIVKFRITENQTILLPERNGKGKTQNVNREILAYNKKQNYDDKQICDLLQNEICSVLPKAENKIWHRSPVWFIDGNPIVGYNKEKRGLRLMFWSGADFDEPNLSVRGKKFKDASVFYNNIKDINLREIKRWLKKSKTIQWDYKNIVKRKGVLVRLK